MQSINCFLLFLLILRCFYRLLFLLPEEQHATRRQPLKLHDLQTLRQGLLHGGRHRPSMKEKVKK
jgi:hypothetical protein